MSRAINLERVEKWRRIASTELSMWLVSAKNHGRMLVEMGWNGLLAHFVICGELKSPRWILKWRMAKSPHFERGSRSHSSMSLNLISVDRSSIALSVLFCGAKVAASGQSPPAARAPRAATRPRRRAGLRIFVVRGNLPCDPPVGGHSCNGGMIPRFHRAVRG